MGRTLWGGSEVKAEEGGLLGVVNVEPGVEGVEADGSVREHGLDAVAGLQLREGLLLARLEGHARPSPEADFLGAGAPGARPFHTNAVVNFRAAAEARTIVVVRLSRTLIDRATEKKCETSQEGD